MAAGGDLPAGSPAVGNDEPPSSPPKKKPATVDWELAGNAGYLSAPIRGGTTPFGFGFGARFGMIVTGAYFGVNVVDYLGGTDVTLSDSALLFGGEIGYGVVLHEFESFHGTLVLRPLVGVGNAAVSHTDPATVQNAKPDVVTTASGRTVTRGAPSDTTTVDNVYVRPALALMLVTGWHFAALEGSALVIPGISYGGADPTSWISYGGQLQLGLRF